jgi:hypothetical protein
MQEKEGRAAGEVLESGGQAVEGVGGGIGGGSAIQHVSLDGPEAAGTPEGGDHIFHEPGFDVVLREEAAEIGGEVIAEACLGFPGHDDTLGEKAVTDGVLGGAELALRCFGPAGEASVGPAGEDAAYRRHNSTPATI